jgi:hypothetical protein
MKSPQPPNQNTLLPPASDEVEVLNQVNSHSDTISQKFQASGGERVSLSSQLGPQDIGIPTTPEQHAVRPIDEAASDQGYDSEGLQAPWEEAKELDFDGLELDENPLPFTASPVSSTGPNCQNITEDICTIKEAEKLKVTGLKDELKKHGLHVRGKKDELKARLKEAIEQKLPFVDDTTKAKTTNLAGDTFSPGAY